MWTSGWLCTATFFLENVGVQSPESGARVRWLVTEFTGEHCATGARLASVHRVSPREHLDACRGMPGPEHCPSSS